MKINTMNFDMLKYYKVPSSRSKLGYALKDRCDIELLDFEEKENGYVTEIFTDEIMNETIEYFTKAIEEIESLDENIGSYPKSLNPEKDFFCKNLCSFRERCLTE